MFQPTSKARGSPKIFWRKGPSKWQVRLSVGSSALCSFPSARNLKRTLSVLYLGVCDLICSFTSQLFPKPGSRNCVLERPHARLPRARDEASDPLRRVEASCN